MTSGLIVIAAKIDCGCECADIRIKLPLCGTCVVFGLLNRRCIFNGMRDGFIQCLTKAETGNNKQHE